jgi:hypothetical protein
MDLNGPAVRESKRDLISVEAMKAANLQAGGGGDMGTRVQLPRFLRTLPVSQRYCRVWETKC